MFKGHTLWYNFIDVINNTWAQKSISKIVDYIEFIIGIS